MIVDLLNTAISSKNWDIELTINTIIIIIIIIIIKFNNTEATYGNTCSSFKE